MGHKPKCGDCNKFKCSCTSQGLPVMPPSECGTPTCPDPAPCVTSEVDTCLLHPGADIVCGDDIIIPTGTLYPAGLQLLADYFCNGISAVNLWRPGDPCSDDTETLIPLNGLMIPYSIICDAPTIPVLQFEAGDPCPGDVATLIPTNGRMIPSSVICSGYGTYAVSLVQTGTSAPVATELLNPFGVTFTWSYLGVGTYLVTASSPIFVTGKTEVIPPAPVGFPNYDTAGHHFAYDMVSTTVIQLQTSIWDNTVSQYGNANGILGNDGTTIFKIIVYD